jgi:hypothetical protein
MRSEGDYCLLEYNAVLTGNVIGISKNELAASIVRGVAK